MLTNFRLSNLVLIFPQRLTVYIFAHHILCTSDKTYFFPSFFFPLWLTLSNVTTSLLGKLKATLKKYQDRDILNLIRSQANIKNELLTQFRDTSQVCHCAPFFVISCLMSVFRSIVKCSSRTFSTSYSSSI
jgi:hypothetical protein